MIPKAEPQTLLPHLVMPEHHEVRPKKMVECGYTVPQAAVPDRGPTDFVELLLAPGPDAEEGR